MEELFTVEEVLKKFKVNRTTLYRYMNDGKITAVKVGNRTMFRERDLKKFVDSLPEYSAEK